jgi:hypothetical protein
MQTGAGIFCQALSETHGFALQDIPDNKTGAGTLLKIQNNRGWMMGHQDYEKIAGTR